MYEYNANVARVVDGDTVVLDIDLGFGLWIHATHVRLSDVSAPEKGTLNGQQWIDWWHAIIAEHGPKIIIRTTKAPKQSLSRWLGQLCLQDGTPIADLLDPQKARRFKHEG